MTQSICKRFWEGTIGVKIKPLKKRDGSYYWTFSFVRAFKRGDTSPWEYAQYYHQQDAKRLGLVMSKAFKFMEETDPGVFVESSEYNAAESNHTLAKAA